MTTVLKCLTCPGTSDLVEFATNKVKGHVYTRKYCKVCWSRLRKQDYENNLKSNRERSRKAQAIRRKRSGYRQVANKAQRSYLLRMRTQVETLFGNKCALCPVDDRAKLQIDHVNGGGHKEFDELAPHQLYRKVLNDQTGYQLLCANCNWRKRIQRIRPKVAAMRIEAIGVLGGACASCGDSSDDVLQFHHRYHDGWADKKPDGSSLNAIARYKLILGSPRRFKLLCANCHSAEHRG